MIVTLGSKEGLANLAQAITAPGDVVLAPNPSYPIHTFGFIIAGAAIRSIPAAPGEDFFRRLELAMRYTVPRPKVLVVGYPSNPTAYVADLAFYERLVAFAREHELIVISDLAYAEIYFGDTPTPSILQVEGAKEVAVEFTSMSKTYSMAGWRIGFAVGNPRLIEALARVKSYLDYGAFTPVQAAAVAALNGPQDIVEANRKLYKKRRDVLVESFGRAGWDIPVPQASMFAWAPIPERFRDLGSMEFSKRLLTEAHVAVAPGVGFGEEGEGFVRIALVENEQRLRQAARGVKRCWPRKPECRLLDFDSGHWSDPIIADACSAARSLPPFVDRSLERPLYAITASIMAVRKESLTSRDELSHAWNRSLTVDRRWDDEGDEAVHLAR